MMLSVRFLAVALCCCALSASLVLATPDILPQAIADYNAENYEEALSRLLELRASGDTSPATYYYLGLCQKQTGELDAAIDSLKGALVGKTPEKKAALELIPVLIELDRVDEAMNIITWAEQEKLDPPAIAYLKGMLLTKQKRYAKAREAFTAARTGNPESDQAIDIQIAVALANEGKTNAARDSLKAIVTRYPGSDAATLAQEYEQRISSAGKGRGWGLYGGFSYIYDDNVILKSKTRDSTTSTANENSSGITENIRIEHDTGLGGAWSLNTQYFIQNNNYLRIHEYNMFSQGLTVGAVQRSDDLILSLPVNINHQALDYRNYALQYSVKPTGTIIMAPDHLLQITTGYSRRDMSQAASNSETNRDANIANSQLGYIHLYADGQGMLNLRGEIVYEDSSGSEWRNLGTRAGADLLIPVFKDTRLILSAEGFWQDYGDSALKRRDTTFTGTTTINQKLTDAIYLNLQHTYTRAISNINLYDYQRNLIMSGLEFRY